MPDTYTDIELRRAFSLTAYKPAGLDFETAMRNPLYAKVIEAKAASDRQLRRDLDEHKRRCTQLAADTNDLRRDRDSLKHEKNE